MINHELPGYPSIDRPWLKYYRQEVIVSSLPDGSIYDELLASCKDTPDAPALNYYGKKTTYGDLLKNIMLAAKAFSALGVKAGDIVTLFSLNTPETIYCIYALNYLGAVPNLEYVTLSEKEAADTLMQTGSRYVLILDVLLKKFSALCNTCSVDKIIVLPVHGLTSKAVEIRQKLRRAGQKLVLYRDFLKSGRNTEAAKHTHIKNELAVIVHSGGTTGVPKGVMLSNEALNSIAWQYANFDAEYKRGDTFMHSIPPFHADKAGLNAKWIRKDMTHPECQEFTKQVLDHMRERLSDYQEQYGDLYNLEATPAESTSYRLAKHDVELYPDIITAAEPGGTPYYTNSSHLPVGFTDDIFEALDIQDDLQTRYTSGTVFHAFLGEKLPSWEAAANLVRKIAENYKLPYYTLSPTYSVCKNHGYLNGEQFTCPECGEPAEVYSRITGYYRPVQNWNAGKTQEYKERKEYDVGHSVLHHSGPLHPDAAPAPAEEHVDEAHSRAILFATPTCPNCRIACSYLDKAGFKYEKLMAEEHAELALSYGVKQAPTLVITDGKEFEKFAGAGAIKTFLAGQKQ